MLIGVYCGVKIVLEGEGRTLGMTTGRFDCSAASVRPVDLLRRLRWVEPLHDALSPYPIKFAVKSRRLSHEVVSKVGPAEVFEVDRSELPA